MLQRVGPDGEVTVPHDLLERAGLRAGDAGSFELRGDTIVLRPQTAGAPAGRFAGSGMAARLLEDRAGEPR